MSDPSWKWGMKTPCPTCGSEESKCGVNEVENLKGVKRGFFLPYVHIERLGTVVLRDVPRVEGDDEGKFGTKPVWPDEVG